MKSKLIGLILLLSISPIRAAVDFDGTDDYVALGSIVDGDPLMLNLKNVSVSMWFYQHGFNDIYPRLMDKSTAGSGTNGYSFFMSDDTSPAGLNKRLSTAVDVGSWWATTNEVYNLNEWTHVVFVISFSGVPQIYVNGVSEAGDYITGSATVIPNVTANMAIGNWNHTTGDRQFDGLIDDIRVYDRILTQSEISMLSNKARKRTGGILDWKSDTTAEDSGSGGNDGSLHGYPHKEDDCQISGCLDFNGTRDAVIIEDSASLSFGDGSTDSPFSITAWIKMDDATTFPILTKSSNSTTGTLEWIFNTNPSDILNMFIYDDTSAVNIRQNSDSTVTSYEGSWIHVSGTYDGSSSETGINLFIDGSTIASTGGTSGSYVAMHDTPTPVNIGRRFAFHPTIKGFADGLIDDVRLYDVELSTQDVSDIYNGISISTSPLSHWTLDNVGPGLVAHWEMDDKEVGRPAGQALDSSTNTNHGVFTNFANLATAFSTDISTNVSGGTALEFDGVDDYLDLGDVTGSDSGTELTISYWLNPDSTYASLDWSISKWDASDNTENTFGARSGATADEFLVFIAGNPDSGGNYLTTTDLNLASDTWTHLAIVYDGSLSAANRLKLFSNATQVSGSITGTIPTSLNNSASSIRLGHQVVVSQNFYDGQADDIRIYNVALSTNNLTYLATNGASGTDPGTSNLIGHWPLNDSAVKDFSGNNNHGKGVGGDSMVHSGGPINRN